MMAAQTRVGVAEAAWFPNLSLTAFGGYASPELDAALASHREQVLVAFKDVEDQFSGLRRYRCAPRNIRQPWLASGHCRGWDVQ